MSTARKEINVDLALSVLPLRHSIVLVLQLRKLDKRFQVVLLQSRVHFKNHLSRPFLIAEVTCIFRHGVTTKPKQGMAVNCMELRATGVANRIPAFRITQGLITNHTALDPTRSQKNSAYILRHIYDNFNTVL